ncbi:MAG: hypothetical protein JOZ73_01680 [Solirubrobacterales bacterium]|nr:hypothetical protein [Solirubrobacterales bacterium]
MRTVLSFENFDGFGGTETYMLTVAQQLERLGHDALVYTPNAGRFAEFARGQGVRVIGRDQLPADCDAFFAQDAASCHELASRFPAASRVLAVHSRDHALQGAPQVPDVCDLLVVFNDRVHSWVESSAWHPRIARLSQPVDLKRFFELGFPRPSPSRALVLSNYLDGPRAELINAACQDAGLKVEWVGVTTSPSSTPEWAIADADIVIGQGRCIVEAMAAGRAAYVYGTVGGDGWVTPDSYPRLEADGFAGLSTAKATEPSAMSADLKRWDPTMGELNRDLASAHHDARRHVVELVDLMRELRPNGGASRSEANSPANELARLVRLEWQTYGRATAASVEVGRLRAELDRQAEETRAAQQNVAEAQRELEQFRSTRRYRIACTIASPLDRLRARRATRA